MARLGAGAFGGQLARVARVPVDGRQDLEAYEESRKTLEGMVHQISQKEKDYQAVIEKQQVSAEELRSREANLDEPIAELRSDRNRTATSLQELEAAERVCIQRSRAATTGGTAGKGYQIGIARDKIVTRPVAPIPRREYVELYKGAVKGYGFGRD